MQSSVFLVLLLVGVSLAVQTPYNVLGINTGDFGGEQFPRRNVLQTFVDTDFNDEIISYGVNIPFNDFTNNTDTIYSAAIDFDSLLVPFRFAQVLFNPGSDGDGNYDYPHYSIRLWFYPSEFARGIECAGSNYPPCQLTPFLDNRFSTQAPSQYYPSDYSWASGSQSPAAGTFIEPNNIPSGQDQAIFRFGSYNGELVFYEILLPETYLSSSNNGPLDFDYLELAQYPITGLYFRHIHINTSGTKYKVSFEELSQAPGFIPAADVFSGPNFRPSEGVYTNSVSRTKDCVVSQGNGYECGYKVIDTEGTEFCCRSRGRFDGFSCLRNTCSGEANLVNPPDAFFAGDSLFCFARCATHRTELEED